MRKSKWLKLWLVIFLASVMMLGFANCGKSGGGNNNTTSGSSADTTAPSVPTGLTATAISQSQINLT